MQTTVTFSGSSSASAARAADSTYVEMIDRQ
jgi:hypothetical protein